MTAKRMWIAGLGLLIVAAVAVTGGLSFHFRDAQAAENDVELVIDCDPSTPAVFESTCNIGNASTYTLNVVVRNTSASAFILGTFNFEVLHDSTTAFDAPNNSDQLNGNPDFLADATDLGDWACGPPNPDDDLGDPSPGDPDEDSFLSCFNSVSTGPQVASGGTLVLAAVTYNVTADATQEFTIRNGTVADDTFLELMTCNPVIAMEGDCFGATVTRGAAQPPTPTDTPEPPTATNTSVPPTPTNTPVPPTPTATNTPLPPTPTDTPVVEPPTPTDTPVVEPTATDTPLPEPTATDTPVVEPPTPTDTPVVEPPTPTDTPVVEPTATDTPVVEPTATDTPVGVPTDTPVPTATDTPVVEPTATDTPLPEPTATDTPVPTATNTPVVEPTATDTPLPEPTATDTPVATATNTPVTEPTATNTPVVSQTPPVTRTVQATRTAEVTRTVTRTPEPDCLTLGQKLSLFIGIRIRFGAEEGDWNFKARFDLNHDGKIGWQDLKILFEIPLCRHNHRR